MTTYIRVQRGYKGVAEKGPSFTDPIDSIDLKDLFDGADVGDQYVLTLVEMSDEEHGKLPEFTGF